MGNRRTPDESFNSRAPLSIILILAVVTIVANSIPFGEPRTSGSARRELQNLNNLRMKTSATMLAALMIGTLMLQAQIVAMAPPIY